MKLIVGLGNPGKEYEKTRHNAGFLCIDNYVDNSNWGKKFDALYLETTINNEKTIFIKPQTYMNLSGIAVKKFVDYFKINLDEILVIQDDLDLPLGQYRLKYKSSDGGHNGIKSIIKELGTNEFARLKIGISNDKTYDTKDYVLGHFNKEELLLLNNVINISKDIIECYVTKGIESTMCTYNKK